MDCCRCKSPTLARSKQSGAIYCSTCNKWLPKTPPVSAPAPVQRGDATYWRVIKSHARKLWLDAGGRP